MRRREFITLVGSAAAWPLAARAQQPVEVPRVNFVYSGPKAAIAPHAVDSDRPSGFWLRRCRTSRDVARFAEGDPDHVGALVNEVIHSSSLFEDFARA